MSDVPPSREEFRQLEARLDAWFQAVNARLGVVDRRFDAVTERIETLELHMLRFREAAREVLNRLLDTGDGPERSAE